MKALRLVQALAALVLVVPVTASAGDPDAYEKRLLDQLAAISKPAAEAFRKANEARDRDDYHTARAQYVEVRRLAPGFTPATRRLCGIERQFGARDAAVTLCRAAVETEASAPNWAALALALSTPPRNEGDALRAARAARQAMEDASEEEDVRYAADSACRVALAVRDYELLERCTRELESSAPKKASTHVYLANLALLDQRPDDAKAALDRAVALGLSKDQARDLSRRIERDRPKADPVAVAGRIAAGWAGGLVALLVIGWALSRFTLAAATRMPAQKDGSIDVPLRSVYRAVLWLTCAYYYLSLPVVILGSVGLAGLLAYWSISSGVYSIKLFLAAIFFGATTGWAALKSLLVERSVSEPGARLDVREHPKLVEALREAASRVGSFMVDTVYITSGAELAVTELDTLFGAIRGAKRRCLILGVGLLKGMRVVELKAVLAHEFGHLRNEDTAGGGFALAVRRSLLTLAESLARSGAAHWYNPSWIFVNVFLRVFLVVSQGASRLQEVLADRWAINAYGSDAFERGMRHAISRAVRHDVLVELAVRESLSEKKAIVNLYAHVPQGGTPNLEGLVEDTIHREPSVYDSHPTPAERIAWATLLAVKGPPPGPSDDAPAWSLFASREKLERQMTDELRIKLLAQGIVMPRPTAADLAAAGT